MMNDFALDLLEDLPPPSNDNNALVILSNCDDKEQEEEQEAKNMIITRHSSGDLVWDDQISLWNLKAAKLPTLVALMDLALALDLALDSSKMEQSSSSPESDNNNIITTTTKQQKFSVGCFPKHYYTDLVYCDSRRVKNQPPQWEWYKPSSSDPTIGTGTGTTKIYLNTTSMIDKSNTISTEHQQQHQQHTTTTTTDDDDDDDDNSISRGGGGGGGQRRRPKLLIAQYYGSDGVYAELLNVTGQVSKIYCRLWGCDVVLLQGIAWKVPGYDDLCTPPPDRASFGKITLLQTAISMIMTEEEDNNNNNNNDNNNAEYYDYMLLLNADAMIYDWTKDVTELLDTEYMLTGQQVNSNDKSDEGRHTWNINNGVTLWNLRHNETRNLVQHWNYQSPRAHLEIIGEWRAMDREERRKRVQVVAVQRQKQQQQQQQLLLPWRLADLRKLHDALRSRQLEWAVNANNTGALRYRDGTVIKHLLRNDHNTWGNATDLESRLQQVSDWAKALCQTHYPARERMNE